MNDGADDAERIAHDPEGIERLAKTVRDAARALKAARNNIDTFD